MKKKINLITFNINKKIQFLNNINYKKNFFIGDWCCIEKNYFIESKIKNLDINEFKNFNKKKKNMKTVVKIYNSLLSLFSKELNNFHNKKFSVKSWEIIIGRWLYTYVLDVYARWLIIEKIEKKFFIKNFYELDLTKIDFTPLNTFNYRMAVREHNQYYSHLIFAKIMKFKQYDKKNLIKLKVNSNHVRRELSHSKFHEDVYGVYCKFVKKKMLFYKTSLERKIIFNFFKKFYFINYPLKKKKIKLKSFEDNKILRNNFFYNLNLNSKKKSAIERFLKELAILTFPRSFLEDFSELSDLSNKMKWPSKINYIFTTYGHYNDEVFKIYCATKRQEGSKIYIFQHGAGGIFSDNDLYGLRSDLNVADKLLGWGKNKKENIKPFFYIKKTISKKNFNFNKEKKILVLLYQLNETVVFPPYGFVSRDKINRIVFNDFILMTKKLNKNLLKEINVKILESSSSGIKSFRNSVKIVNPSIKFIESKKSFNNIIEQYNLTIHYRISTVFFESILYNIPTILILKDYTNINFDEKFNKCINQMIKKKIAFRNLNEAILFINKYYFNLNSWWNSKELQKFKNYFSELYCRGFNSKNNDFRNFFVN